MHYDAQIIADSVNPTGQRLTTFQLTYPRVVHAEIMTHRMFSRNASSSRAIPVSKTIERVRDNPYIPASWMSNKPGMQGGAPIDADAQLKATQLWIEASERAVCLAQQLAALGVHKEHANRCLEPFSTITVICSSTNYANFFAQRCHEAASPILQTIAYRMREAYDSSRPVERSGLDWHLPYVSPDERQMPFALKLSVARCARVSYLNHDGTRDLEKDVQLYHDLLDMGHFTPFEHQALPDEPVRSGNFFGWIQHRKLLPNEYISEPYEGR